MKNQRSKEIEILTTNEKIVIGGGQTTVRQEEDETVIIPLFIKPFFPKLG